MSFQLRYLTRKLVKHQTCLPGILAACLAMAEPQEEPLGQLARVEDQGILEEAVGTRLTGGKLKFAGSWDSFQPSWHLQGVEHTLDLGENLESMALVYATCCSLEHGVK